MGLLLGTPSDLAMASSSSYHPKVLAKQNKECYWMDEDTDDGQPRTLFFLEKCPIEGCGSDNFKRACCWSWESADAVKSYWKRHAIVSQQETHALDEEVADNMADHLEISEKLETYEERAEYRAEEADRIKKKEEQKARPAINKPQPPKVPPPRIPGTAGKAAKDKDAKGQGRHGKAGKGKGRETYDIVPKSPRRQRRDSRSRRRSRSRSRSRRRYDDRQSRHEMGEA